MWKKEDASDPTMPGRPDPVTPVAPVAERVAMPTTKPPVTIERATIGRSISIKGEVTGDEDLLIQGRVEGSVNLKQHSVTVGREGEVKADISGKVITIEGRVQGNLMADEQVVLRSSAQVQGDIVSPRVVLEDGARFRGGIDMGEMPQVAVQRSPASKPAQAGRPEVTPATPAEADKSAGGNARKPAEVTA
jgi:cytoskeletal protein CcmA (bactofilin family)